MDANAVNEADARLRAQEAIENARLAAEQGLGATNMLALSMMHARNDAQTQVQKKAVIDKILADLESYRAQVERAKTAAKRHVLKAAEDDVVATAQALEKQAFQRAEEQYDDLLDRRQATIEGLNIGNCRFIDMVDERSGEVLGYLVQCMNYLDVFDEDNAIFGLQSNGERGLLFKHAIHGEKVGALDVFKIKGEDFAIFVSERMKKAFEKNKCVGFAYMKIKS